MIKNIFDNEIQDLKLLQLVNESKNNKKILNNEQINLFQTIIYKIIDDKELTTIFIFFDINIFTEHFTSYYNKNFQKFLDIYKEESNDYFATQFLKEFKKNYTS